MKIRSLAKMQQTLYTNPSKHTLLIKLSYLKNL